MDQGGKQPEAPGQDGQQEPEQLHQLPVPHNSQ